MASANVKGTTRASRRGPGSTMIWGGHSRVAAASAAEPRGPGGHRVTEPLKDRSVCVVGLGYVGLPLAVEFARRHHVIGLDIDESKIGELRRGHDRMLEVPEEELKQVTIDYTSDPARL